MALQYTQKVIEHFTNPQNVGEIKHADAQATEGSPACGDMITFTLKVDPKTRIIQDIRFKSYGCASNIATASVATVLAKGKTIDEVKKLNSKQIMEELGGLPAIKVHCAVLAVNALKASVKDWEIRQGLAEKETIELSPRVIRRLLEPVTNPQTGEPIVPDMLKDVQVDDGKVYVELKLGDTDDSFTGNIMDEVTEAISEMKCVKQIMVRFVDSSKSVLKQFENAAGCD
jgi:nitrogen fixation NifU-like protein